MKNIVLIPAYRRPEFLYLCLLMIRQAEHWQDYKYRVCLDQGFDWLCRDVIKWAIAEGMDIDEQQTNYTGYTMGKQSYNVMHNLVKAASDTAEYVYMIEDDIMVSNQFFNWHRAAHATDEDVCCYIASANNNTKFNTTYDREAYYVGVKADYQGLGISYKKDFILNHIAPHDKREYYQHPINYCKRHFADSFIGNAFAEQDGLIRRVMERNDLRAMFPHVPQCYHAGYYGKNRGRYPAKMTLQDKIDTVSKIIFSDEAMKHSVEHQEWYEDSKPISLVQKQINKLHKIQP